MVTHNNDCTDCDLRLAIIPEKHHDKGKTITNNQSGLNGGQLMDGWLELFLKNNLFFFFLYRFHLSNLSM
jgi:hypothetical protein